MTEALRIKEQPPSKAKGFDHPRWIYGVYGQYYKDFVNIPARKLRKRLRTDGLHPIGLGNFTPNPWGAMEKAGIHPTEVRRLKTRSFNQCGVIPEMHYYSVVPMAIFAQPEHVLDYIKRMPQHLQQEPWIDMLLDHHHACMGWVDEEGRVYDDYGDDIDNVTRAIMGSGYTDGTLPCDGSAHLEEKAFELTNGDYLLVTTWAWCNK